MSAGEKTTMTRAGGLRGLLSRVPRRVKIGYCVGWFCASAYLQLHVFAYSRLELLNGPDPSWKPAAILIQSLLLGAVWPVAVPVVLGVVLISLLRQS